MELKRLSKNVTPIFCGLTPRSSTSISILRDIVWELENVTREEHLHIRLKREDGIEFEDIKLSDWREQFVKCCDLLSKKVKNIILLLMLLINYAKKIRW